MKILHIFVLLVFLNGCSAVPRMEFGAYIAAFDQTHTATRQVLETFEPVEKAFRQPSIRSFDPNEAAYMVDEGMVGNSALILQGFAAISDYNQILVLYAEGGSVSLLKPEVEKMAANLSLLSLTLNASGLAIASQAGIKGMNSLANALVAVSDRRELSRVVKAHSGKVDRFLEEVRNFTPSMYDLYLKHANERAIAAGKKGLIEEAKKLHEVRSEFRKMLASWVLTIDRTRAALNQLEMAISQSNGGLTTANLIFWTEEINRHAEAVKHSAKSIRKILN